MANHKPPRSSRAAAPAAAPKPKPRPDAPALLADGAYVTGVLIDSDRRGTSTGLAGVLYTFEVVKPRAYAGRQLYFYVHEALDKTLEALADRFPDANWLDAEDVWGEYGAQPFRLRVRLEPKRDNPADPAKPWPARNRVGSLWPMQVLAAQAAAIGDEADQGEVFF